MNDLYAVAVAIFAASASVLIHFEALNLLGGVLRKIQSRRGSVLAVMIGLLIAHTVEIWLYGGAYVLLEQVGVFGELLTTETAPLDWLDRVYYSGMVYTTVGFGDITPTGALRLLSATEALIGLSMITWSASFAFIQMEKLWRY